MAPASRQAFDDTNAEYGTGNRVLVVYSTLKGGIDSSSQGLVDWTE